MLSLLRSDDGAWRKFSRITPADRDTEIFIGPDKSPKQIKMEMEGNKLLQVFKEKCPTLKPYLLRAEGVISVGWVPILNIEVAHGDESSAIHWNNAAVAEHGDRPAVPGS